MHYCVVGLIIFQSFNRNTSTITELYIYILPINPIADKINTKKIKVFKSQKSKYSCFKSCKRKLQKNLVLVL